MVKKKVALLLSGFLRDNLNIDEILKYISLNQKNFDIYIFINSYNYLGVPTKIYLSNVKNTEKIDENTFKKLNYHNLLISDFNKINNYINSKYEKNEYKVKDVFKKLHDSQPDRNYYNINNNNNKIHVCTGLSQIYMIYLNLLQVIKSDIKFDYILKYRFDNSKYCQPIIDIGENDFYCGYNKNDKKLDIKRTVFTNDFGLCFIDRVYQIQFNDINKLIKCLDIDSIFDNIAKIDDNTIEVFKNSCILGAEWLYFQQLLKTFNFKLNNYYNSVRRDKKYPDKIEENFDIYNKKKKVAIVLSGFVRGTDNFDQVNKFIENNSDNYDFYKFISVYDVMGTKTKAYQGGQEETENVSLSTFNNFKYEKILISNYKNVIKTIDNILNNEFQLIEKCMQFKCDSNHKINFHNCLCRWNLQNLGLKLIKDTNLSFDYVILTRFDLKGNSIPKFTELNKDEIGIPLRNDNNNICYKNTVFYLSQNALDDKYFYFNFNSLDSFIKHTDYNYLIKKIYKNKKLSSEFSKLDYTSKIRLFNNEQIIMIIILLIKLKVVNLKNITIVNRLEKYDKTKEIFCNYLEKYK